MSFEELEKKYAVPVQYSLKTRVKRKVKSSIKIILQVMCGIRLMRTTDYSLCFVFDCEEKLK